MLGLTDTNLEDRLHEIKRIKLTRVPNHSLSHNGTKEGKRHEFDIVETPECLKERVLDQVAVTLHPNVVSLAQAYLRKRGDSSRLKRM
jgi:hypothetical protein